MNIRLFPSCCAGIILENFGGTKRTSGPTFLPTEEELKVFFQKADDSLKQYGFAMLTINNEQLEFMKPILEEFNYECVGNEIPSRYHYKSTVYIYMKSTKK